MPSLWHKVYKYYSFFFGIKEQKYVPVNGRLWHPFSHIYGSPVLCSGHLEHLQKIPQLWLNGKPWLTNRKQRVKSDSLAALLSQLWGPKHKPENSKKKNFSSLSQLDWDLWIGSICKERDITKQTQSRCPCSWYLKLAHKVTIHRDFV